MDRCSQLGIAQARQWSKCSSLTSHDQYDEVRRFVRGSQYRSTLNISFPLPLIYFFTFSSWTYIFIFSSLNYIFICIVGYHFIAFDCELTSYLVHTSSWHWTFLYHFIWFSLGSIYLLLLLFPSNILLELGHQFCCFRWDLLESHLDSVSLSTISYKSIVVYSHPFTVIFVHHII